ncbi:MAG: heme o synthase [Anaerolineales bacterium]|jgi:protoheme IX farnesyltransferase
MMQNPHPISTDSNTLPGSVLNLDLRTKIKTIAGLFKLRIVLLLLISALGGAILGAGGWPGMQALTLVLITGGLSAAGASAVNQYLERDRDAQMKRTRKRPLPSGAVKKSTWVLIVGVGMIVFAVVLSAVYNPALAISNALGAIIYIGVYTIWLKPRTVLNIVIGGAAGSMAVVSGGAAAGNWNEPGVLALALLVFAWTPTHFWSLAMAYRKDYAHAGFPMLPVNVTMQQAAWWVAVHTLATGFIALVLGFHPALGLVYLVPVSFLSIQYVRLTIHLLRNPEGKLALSLFKYSNIYLSIVQLIIIFLPLFK